MPPAQPWLCLLAAAAAAAARPAAGAALTATVFNNTAHAGLPVHNLTVADPLDVLRLLEPWQSVVIEGRVAGTAAARAPVWALFSVDTDAGFVRLRVDDHLLVDGGPAAAAAPSCSFPGGDPSALPGYSQWLDVWMPVNSSSSSDPRSMAGLGGDCTKGCSRAVCEALCEKLAPQGCVGFYTHTHQWNFCSMRKLASAADRWQDLLQATTQPYTAYTRRASCPSAGGSFCPAGAPPSPAGAGANGTAGYAIPVPFLPGRTYSKLRLELTLGATVPTRLALLANGTALTASKLELDSTVSAAEQRYDVERAANEVGWNTWLSRDMLTHAWLPSGIALSISLHHGKVTVEELGAQGPSCSASKFPAKHGLHARRGEYTEIETITVGSEGASFRVESATAGASSSSGADAGTELHIVITTLSVPTDPSNSTALSGSDEQPFAVLSLGVPLSYRPRVCNVTTQATKALVGSCPGFAPVAVHAASGTKFRAAGGPGSLMVQLATSVGGTVSFTASASATAGMLTDTAAAAAASSKPGHIVAAAREKLLQQFSRFRGHNETYAGLVASIAWNIVYNPYEGIITPVFRGAPWSASKPHAYVMFEWDTFLASMIASITDPWAAANGIIRMTKALHFRGYVPGFWNGLCGEVDKSKPPVGGLALHFFLEHHPEDVWVAELLLEQYLMWNRWWGTNRQFSVATGSKNATVGLVAPGSTRAADLLPLQCQGMPDIKNRVDVVTGETGLDNSPLYDVATYLVDEGAIDTVDVGLSAIHARDSLALANVSRLLGRGDLAAELQARGAATTEQLNSVLWHDGIGAYVNRLWTNGSWSPIDPQTGVYVLAPTTFYPMLARAPTDAQVERMIPRFLTNGSEFAVNNETLFGMPSVSRSSSAAKDNNYWRGRSWGPMNFLTYLGLREYQHLPSARQAMRDLAAQSEATFLSQWVDSHYVMENYNSFTGAGCDSGDAVPFYHWGALNALTGLMEAKLV